MGGKCRGLTLPLLLAALVAGSHPAAGQCVVAPEPTPPFLPDGSTTVLLVRAVARFPRDTASSRPALRYIPHGQMVTVEEAEQPGRTFLAPGSLAAIVRWVHGSELEGCGWVPARDSLATGTRHLIRAALRPDSLWLEGRPTFDVYSLPLADFSPGTQPGSPSLAEYRSFLRALPTRKDWETDCRPGIEQVRRWLDVHPAISRYRPVSLVSETLVGYCLRSLAAHARGLERGVLERKAPGQAVSLYRSHGCVDDSASLTTADGAVAGHFVASDAPQWAFLCPHADSWELLVVILESPVRTIELLRMAGHDWKWLVTAAPPDYFDWVCSEDTGTGRYHERRPERDIVLLQELQLEDTQLAFYQTPDGWVHARTRYCRQLH